MIDDPSSLPLVPSPLDIPALVAGDDVLHLDSRGAALGGAHMVVVARHLLQRIVDYRAALRDWMGVVADGGHLLVTVPHAFLCERRLALSIEADPSHRRLYSPRVLMDEVEEALPPNTYRVRSLSDDDRGYDYDAAIGVPPVGPCAIVLVLQKVAPPPWSPASDPVARLAPPDFAFERPRTRVEVTSTRACRSVLILKLDHLGDFIMSIGALQTARARFGNAHITMVVGSWNVDLVRTTGLADEVIAFDVFPRNSTEEEVDVAGRTGLFQQLPLGRYDLAIDLRVDTDTRFLLRHVQAGLRAGVGTRAQFPFLDIFLPVNESRNAGEAARQETFPATRFAWQGAADRSPHRIRSNPDRVERDCAIVWGPYDRLTAGSYVFEPHVEIDDDRIGLVMLDVALDEVRVAQVVLDRAQADFRIPFNVPASGMRFEFRIWAMDDAPSLAFTFFGGRLIRQGGASVLHQSEYQQLLIELIAGRLERSGILEEI